MPQEPDDFEQKTPFVEDPTMLQMHIITPRSEERFRSITRDIVLSNITDADVEFFRVTQNIIGTIESLSLTPSIQREIRNYYPNQKLEDGSVVQGITPIDRVVDVFMGEMAILANATRGVNMAQAKLLQTNITKKTQQIRGERRGFSGAFGSKEQYDEEW